MFSSPRLVILFLLVLTALRLAYVGRVELTPDEAYYQMWSERLDWGYYSKGPGVAVAIRAGTALFGTNEFGVRFLSPLLALGTSLLLYGFTRRLYGTASAGWAVLMLNLIPIFQAGSLLMTIDPLSIFFWAVSMVACWLALERRRVRLPYWLLAGACVGLGFLCKYTNAMELVSIALAMAMVPRWRREFRRAGFYALLFVAAVIGSPPVFWNAGHAWITLNHLHDRGRLGAAYDKPLTEFINFLGAHAGVYSPLVFVGIIIALGWGWRRAGLRLRLPRRNAGSYPAATVALEPDAEKARFLLAFGLPLLVMYTLLAFKTAGEPNWTAPAFMSLSVLAAALWHERARASHAAAAYCVAALGIALASSLLMIDTDLVRQAGLPWPYDRDPTARLVGWHSVADSVALFRHEEERNLGSPVFLIANRYQLAAELNFYLPPRAALAAGHPPVYLPESQNIETQFSFWPGYDEATVVPLMPSSKTGVRPRAGTAEDEFQSIGSSPFVGHSALFVTDDERHNNVPDTVERGFEECALVAQYEIERHGRPLRRVRIYACFNYRGLDL